MVGASMGGMIAQLVAIRHPELVITLTSMMSSTGSPDEPTHTEGGPTSVRRSTRFASKAAASHPASHVRNT